MLHFGQSLWNEARSNYMTVCLTKILLTGKLYAMTYLNWNKITVMLICIPVFYPRCLSSAMQHWLVQLLEILWTWFHQTLRSLTGFVACLLCGAECYSWCIMWCAHFIFPRKACFFLHYLVLGPLEAVVVLGLLWREIGASSLAGMGLLFVMVPMQIKMGDALMYFRWIYFIACLF